MSSIASRIYDASPHNHELLSRLAETRFAIRDLDIHETRIAEIDADLLAAKQRVRQLDEKRESDLKRHTSYRDSVVKKLAYRLSGQSREFAFRAQSGQQEYFDVLQQEQQAKEEEDRISARRHEALATRGMLKAAVERHNQAQSELDVLYDSIFHGPNPEFPEEDEFERQAEAALHTYHCAEMKTQTACRLLDKLTTARQKADHALGEIIEALKGGQLSSSTVERKRLETADLELKSMRQLMAEAQAILPTINTLPPVDIRFKLLTSDVYDNPWSTMALHDMMRGWRSGTQACVDEIQKELVKARSRYDEAFENAKARSSVLRTVKDELQSCRSEIFAIVRSATIDGGDSESPPPY
ncbi:hypothetical protein BKA67DRAFT_549408 [Truncatella angustata]|uniref:Uncharacterized protein n=1 Tax=Truncatella angustata TaxID=152316 RepID=A0A9P8UZJ3_9PEZI|nr:uncharacterized protein BKA67DRAFT_549408 [Truncatella angustata]KAH6660861.1 hypothetical protein BKA67DRAFT_549408 [Truncatella angustata]KAH8199253.1 hypothetical protein TruAng_006593 [Truncatella angustata]